MDRSKIERSASVQRRRSKGNGFFIFESRGDRQDYFFLPRPTDYLHADGQALLGIAHRYHGGGKTQQIEPLAVAPGVEILDGLAFHLPLPLAVTKSWDSGRG